MAEPAASHDTPMIEAGGIAVRYGPVRILKEIGFTVARGETMAIIGPNGAGKTTLFKSLTGEVLPHAGRLLYDGRDITRAPAAERVRRGIGRTFQVARVFPAFTVAMNVGVAVETRRGGGFRFAGAIDRASLAEAERILDQVGLGGEGGLDASLLSYGDKKRLEIAIALALGPRVLMLDEPMAGMSPADRKMTTALIRRLRDEQGLTILLTEHDMDVVFHLADRIMVLNYGEVVAIGTVEEVRRNKAVRDIYLGSGH